METIRGLFFKPDPAVQQRKCQTMLRANARKLDRDIQNLKQVENKTKEYIRQASRRAERDPSQAGAAEKESRIYARELIRCRKATTRLQTSRAQLNSVSMQVSEAFAMRKVEKGLKTSAGIMRDVNSLVKLPELMGSMQALSQELMRAGIIEEMVDDAMDPLGEMDDEEEEEADAEVNKVLGEILKGRMDKVGKTPVKDIPAAPVEEEEEEEDMLDQMRGRLEALKS